MTKAPLLLIDIGNTRIKWAWSEPGARQAGWQAAGAQPHADLPALGGIWRQLRASHGVPEVWISNVAGPVIAQALDAVLAEAFGALPATLQWVRSTPSHGAVDNGYRMPAQLGVDRWLAAIGARHLVPRDQLLIVTAGTATTIDVVGAPDARGRSRFEGGLILPGLALMMGSLARNTAQLPAVELSDDRGASPWADNTHDAIAAGCLLAQTGAITQAWQALAQRGPVHGLLSGGAQDALAPALRQPFVRQENLVLTGLWVMAGGAAAP